MYTECWDKNFLSLEAGSHTAQAGLQVPCSRAPDFQGWVGGRLPRRLAFSCLEPGSHTVTRAGLELTAMEPRLSQH